MVGLVTNMKVLVGFGMPPALPDRSRLVLPFQPCPAGRLGEVTIAAVYWNRGGTHTLERFRRVPDLHLLVMCLEGQSDYLDEGGERRVIGPGDVMLIPRGWAHAYRPTPGHGWSEIHAWLRGPLPDLWWREKFLEPGLTVLRAEALDDAALALCRIFGKPAAGSGSNDERLSALQTWLTRLKEDEGQTTTGAPWFARACRILNEGTMREPELETLAERLGVSYESFRKNFATMAGTSPGQYRVAAVIQRAGRLLRGGGGTSKEIAARLEFADEFHFARTFRQRMGLTPRQYRAVTGAHTPAD